MLLLMCSIMKYLEILNIDPAVSRHQANPAFVKEK